MSSPVVTNSDSDLNGKTLLLSETSATITGGLIPSADTVQVGLVRRIVTPLTNAQIIALPTTGVEVIPAPSAGFRILLLSAIVRITSTGHAYTNIDAAGFAVLRYGSGGGDILSNYIANDAGSTPVLADYTTLLNGGVRSAYFAPQTRTTTPAASEWGNAAIVASANYDGLNVGIRFDNGGSGNLTGGNSANSGTVTSLYVIVAV